MCLFYFFPLLLLESVSSFISSTYPFQTKEPVKNPVVIFFLSHEVPIHHLIPEDTETPSTLLLLKFNTSNPQMAAFHLPLCPLLPPRVTLFSFYTSLHLACLYSCPSAEEKEALLTSLTSVFFPHSSVYFSSLLFHVELQQEPENACTIV